MFCKKCGKVVSEDAKYCSYCGCQLLDTCEENNIVNEETVIIKTNTPIKKSNKKLIISFVSFFVILITLFSVVNNNFGSSLRREDFSYSYVILEDRIEVEIKAKVDIKDFEFGIFCYRQENILHQYHERHKIDYLEKSDTEKYIIKMSDIESEYPWLKKWKLDTIEITSYRGKIRNKEK
ncbi:MAG: zinc-ribbon domain-containing protein [Clostridia bacterium]|nr:zinc-ribbon domain-containing protein [Clostridia bacterium]